MARAGADALVRDARWLIQTAQGPLTRRLEPYFRIAERISASFTTARRLEIHKAGAMLTSGHLRSQLRHRAAETDRPVDDPERARHRRATPIPWMRRCWCAIWFRCWRRTGPRAPGMTSSTAGSRRRHPPGRVGGSRVVAHAPRSAGALHDDRDTSSSSAARTARCDTRRWVTRIVTSSSRMPRSSAVTRRRCRKTRSG